VRVGTEVDQDQQGRIERRKVDNRSYRGFDYALSTINRTELEAAIRNPLSAIHRLLLVVGVFVNLSRHLILVFQQIVFTSYPVAVAVAVVSS
jgi:hypothetical protein